MPPPNSLDVGDENKAFVSDDARGGLDILSPTDHLDDVTDASASFSREDRRAESLFPEGSDHVEGFLVALGDDLKEDEGVQESLLKKRSQEVAHGVSAAIGDELGNLERFSSADDVAENHHVEHDLEEPDAGCDETPSPHEEKDSEGSAAHVEDASAENHQKADNVYVHGDAPLGGNPNSCIVYMVFPEDGTPEEVLFFGTVANVVLCAGIRNDTLRFARGGSPSGMAMRLRILGAAGEVTGSSYLLEIGESRILVDCGLHQGKDEDRLNREPFPLAPESLTAVVFTHAHLDHTGRVPLLVKQGFSGKIWATLPTAELVKVLWTDSAHLMKEEAEWRSRKNARKGLPPVNPLYDEEDVTKALEYLVPASYDDVILLAPGVKVRFRDAGHILGSAVLEFWLSEGTSQKEVKVVFSGDLGPQETVMERNPALIEDADYVVIESTYGDRLHKTNAESRDEFREVMRLALRSKAKVLIPTFVVDRAQRVLYEIMLLQKEGVLEEDLPIFFDSPMGVRATDIYRKHINLLSSEIQGHVHRGDDPFSPEQLRYISDAEESRGINGVARAVVLAGSGMCNGGRIVHHLKHNLWNEKCHVCFVGYQAQGTLGRRLVDGTKRVRIAGEEVSVKARLHTINGFSAHADRRDLLKWAGNFINGPLFIVTHGEPKSSRSLAEGLTGLGFRAEVPVPGQEFVLEAEHAFAPEAVVPVFSGSKEAATKRLLSDVAIMASDIQDADELPDEDLLPLLESSRTLLQIVRDRMTEKARGRAS